MRCVHVWARLFQNYVILVYTCRTAPEDGCRQVVWTAHTSRYAKDARVMISSQMDAPGRSL